MSQSLDAKASPKKPPLFKQKEAESEKKRIDEEKEKRDIAKKARHDFRVPIDVDDLDEHAKRYEAARLQKIKEKEEQR